MKSSTVGVQHIDAGVDPMRKDLFGPRLLEESHDAVIAVEADDAALADLFPVVQGDGRQLPFAAMACNELIQIAPAQIVAVPDNEWLVVEKLALRS